MKMIKIDIDIINSQEARRRYITPHKTYDLEEGTTQVLNRIKTQIEQDSVWTNEFYGKIPYLVEEVDYMLEMIIAIIEHYGYKISIRKKENYITYKITH